MSAFQFYKTLGQTQISPKSRLLSNWSGNAVVWTPASSLRIAVTGLHVSSNLGGTIQFFFGGNNNNQRLAEFSVAGSATISPVIGSWESTAQDAPLFVTSSNMGSNSWSITAEGFELDQ